MRLLERPVFRAHVFYVKLQGIAYLQVQVQQDFSTVCEERDDTKRIVMLDFPDVVPASTPRPRCALPETPDP